MKRMLINVLVMALLVNLICGGFGAVRAEATAAQNITFVDATEGANSREGGENLFDGNSSTKWCVTNFEIGIAIWSLDEKVTPESYVMVTGNDSAEYTGRNPGTWMLLGANGKQAPGDLEDWTVIAVVENDTRMEDINQKAYRYNVDETDTAYRHYMLAVLETRGADVMQLSEFFLEYDGCEYSTGNSGSTGSGSGNDTQVKPTGNFSSAYITDGGEYTIAVGDSFTMYHPRTPTSTYYAYTWIVESGEECVVLDRDQGTCNVIGVKPGTVKLKANLDYTVLGYGWSDSYSYEYDVTIHVVESGNYDHGDVTDGNCPRCHGTGKVDCTACYGDGKLSGGSTCTGCSKGKVTCNHCNGTGRWS